MGNANAAGSWVVQATSGHIFGAAGFGGLSTSDGYIFSPTAGSTNYTFIMPIQLSTTAATTYTPTQYTSNTGAGTVCSRLASFNSDGSFSAGPACSTASTMGGAVTVPANGSLFSESTLNSNGFGAARLNQVKVTWP